MQLITHDICMSIHDLYRDITSDLLPKKEGIVNSESEDKKIEENNA